MYLKKLVILALISIISVVTLSAQLTIYCEDDPPYQIINKDGSLSGLTVEVCMEIQKRVGNTDKIQVVPWARGLNEINTKPNTILFSMSRTAERNPLYKWVGPVKESVYALYVKADSKISINDIEEAKKLKGIGVYNQDIRDQYLTSQGFTNLERVTDKNVNIKKVMTGRLEAFADSEESYRANTVEAGYKESDVKQLFVFMKTQLYIAMSKETPDETVTKWNGALEEMKKDGTFKKIYAKYFPGEALPGPAIDKF
ncbi:MAG: ABC transporter substrate-binding protein [Candidatus Cloacimonadales bacterium]|jgi:polar amino acid transport system substrate-binding protein|nr:ABC transporter substrate-binding protein [Candidatus Cloacimonadota bacterium]MDX9977652.1 ABC transporter substrate-binding protein [Candidatus Cloacimonadales bacterium]